MIDVVDLTLAAVSLGRIASIADANGDSIVYIADWRLISANLREVAIPTAKSSR